MTYYTISETDYQTTIPHDQGTVECTICADHIPKTNAMAGPYNADGKITFICNDHLRDTRQLINLLASYIINERLRLSQEQRDVTNAQGLSPDAWFLY
jgi:hypothetical protein